VVCLVVSFFLGSNYRELAPLANAPQRISVWLTYGTGSHLLGYLCSAVVLLYWFWEHGHYSRRLPFWDGQRQVLRLFLAAATLEGAFLILLSEARFERIEFIASWVWALVLLSLGRIAIKMFLSGIGMWKRPTIIVGTGSNAVRAYAALSNERLMGYPIVAFALVEGQEYSDSVIETEQGSLPVIRLDRSSGDTLSRYGRPNFVVAPDSLSDLEKVVQSLSSYGSLTVIPPLGGLPLYGMEISHFFSHDLILMRVRNNLNRIGMQLVKRFFDLAFSILFLLFFWWIFVYFVLRIRATGGPAIFGHKRVGRHGKEFTCYKFRTMVTNAEVVLKDILAKDPEAAAEWARDFKMKDDPRIISIGRLLRRTSLDELPQIWNVLLGDMSLVGPRPIVAAELERYGQYVDYYLEAKPGITGIWQVSGRNNTTYSERVAQDVWYVRNWSLWYDLVVLLKTVAAVFRREGAY